MRFSAFRVFPLALTLMSSAGAAHAQLSITKYELNASGDSTPQGLTQLGSFIYFAANRGDGNGNELHRFNLTNDTTTLAANIDGGAGDSSPYHLTVANGKLFYRADPGGDDEVWVYNPTGGTNTEIELNAGGASNPGNFTVIGSSLYVNATSSTIGREMFIINTSTNAVQAVDLWAGAGNSSSPTDFTALNGYVYMNADLGDGFGEQLVCYEPGSGTARRVTSLTASFTFVYELQAVSGKLYFRGEASDSEPYLFVPAASPANCADGTVTKIELNPGTSNSSSPTDFVLIGTNLYISANIGANGRELVILDTTGAGTSFTTVDIWSGANSSDPREFILFDGDVYFTADSGDGEGREVHRRTLPGGVVSRRTNIDSAATGSWPNSYAVFNDYLVFRATSGSEDEPYHHTAGTTTATKLDINPGTGAESNPTEIRVLSGRLFISGTGDTGWELFEIVDASPPAAVCGNGVPEAGEACDTGGNSATCDADCTAPACGDGVFNASAEVCDTGGNSATCDADCTAPACGDGVFNASAEVCDTGGNSATCDADCTAPACGDGVFNASAEPCDDGNADNTDACLNSCELAGCGDTFVHIGFEDCDDGGIDTADCNFDCSASLCGDDYQNTAAGEECDDGLANSDTEPDACRSDCLVAYCGDGVQDTGETCDAGMANSDIGMDSCRTNCALPTCGDGVIDTGEECDDGVSNSDTVVDGCRTTCAAAFCGDSIVDTGEECDTGPARSDEVADACRTSCLVASCGDGVVDADEACDDGNANSDSAADACRSTCVVATCGDGVVDSGEECDEGALNVDEPGQCRTDCTHDQLYATGTGCNAGGSGGLGLLVFFTLAWLGRRRRGVVAMATAAGLLMLASVADAQQEGFRVNHYASAATVDDGMTLQLPTTLGHMGVSASLTMGLADTGLVVTPVRDDPDAGIAIVDQQLGAQLNLALGLGSRFELAATVPVTLVQGTDSGMLSGMTFGDASSTAMGDLLLGGSARLFGERRGPQLGLYAGVSLPTGDEDAFAGDGGVGLVSVASFAFATPSVTAAVNAGINLRPERQFLTSITGPELTFRAGVYAPVIAGLTALAELDGVTRLGDDRTFESLQTPLEALLGARYYIPGGFMAGVGGGIGLTDAVGAPTYRLLASLGWRSGAAPAASEDRDRDGVPDDRDACPIEAEDVDGYADGDGCPDSDNDGDRILDGSDRCPNDAEVYNQIDDEDGCPDEVTDADRDGIGDAADACPGDAEDRDGFEDEDGCPDLDNDGDLIADRDDQCPLEAEVRNGFQDDDGCPDARSEPTLEERLPPPIEFEVGSDRLLASSNEAITQVAQVLSEHPELQEIEVQGHASAEGSDAFNQDLSQRRAQAVVDRLVRAGVPRNRLRARGYGASAPLSGNETEEERRHNRRVQFKILKLSE